MKRRAALVLVCSFAAGCMNRVADHCVACSVVNEAQRPPAAVRIKAGPLVVLVHGAFGFGDEWDPIVAALRRSPEIPFVVFAWRGPFHDLSGAVADLTAVVQGALDQSPGLTEVLILAHSAGGPLATRAALRLRVPEGRRVRLAEIDSPALINGCPFFPDRLPAMPEMPPGAKRIVYVAKTAPRRSGAGDPRRVYLGASIDHDRAVALVGLPLLAELAARARQRALADPQPPARAVGLPVEFGR